MVSTLENHQNFIASVIKFLHQYEFDGLDFEWEYTGSYRSPPQDKHLFTVLLQVREDVAISNPRKSKAYSFQGESGVSQAQLTWNLELWNLPITKIRAFIQQHFITGQQEHMGSMCQALFYLILLL